MARLLTGRKKVIARRRSYHGLRWVRCRSRVTRGGGRSNPDSGAYYAPKTPIVIAALTACRRHLRMRCAEHIEHIIEMEGADSIAAVIMEGVTGTNGGLYPRWLLASRT